MSDQQNAREHEDGDSLGNDNSIMSLPSFAPPEAIKAQQEKMELKAAAQVDAVSIPTVDDEVAIVNTDQGVAADAAPDADKAESKEEPQAQAGEEGGPASVAVADASAQSPQTPAAAPQAAAVPAEPANAQASANPVTAALDMVAQQLMTELTAKAGPSVGQDELAKVAERLNLNSAISDPGAAQAFAPGVSPQGAGVATVPVSAGQRAQINGAAALAEGLGMAVGGTMSLVGAAGRVIGRAAQGVASLAKGDSANNDSKAAADVETAKATASPALPSVLPRLSEYRIMQTEKAAELFASEQEKFWQASPQLGALRGEIDRIARERGVPKQDLIEEMKPGGDLAELRTMFNEAVAESPDAMTHKRSMDKALDSYVRQYGRAQEEMLNPEQVGNPHYEGLKARLQGAHEKMEERASEVPAFAKADGELEKAHFEKLREAVAAIMTKIREVIQEFTKLLSGKREVEHAPSP